MDISPELLFYEGKIHGLVDKIKFTAFQRHVLDQSSGQGEYYPIDAGSYDDAFGDGTRVGEIDFARELCGLLGVAYDVPKS